MATLTVSGNEITDAVRVAATQGDGLTAPAGYGIWPAATNLCTNGGFTTNTTGWGPVAPNTIARSTAQSKFGSSSGLLTRDTGTADTNCGAFTVTVPGAGAYTFSLWVYVPTSYDGSSVDINLEGFVGGSGSNAAATLATRDQWQRVSTTYTVAGGDLTGAIVVRLIGASTGKFIYIDGVQIESGSVATPYVETDGGTAARSAARVRASAGLLDETQGWFAIRVRTGAALATGVGPTDPGVWGWFDSGTDYMRAFYVTSAGKWRLQRVGSSSSAAVDIADTEASGDSVTIIAAWTAAALRLSINGSAFSSSATGGIPVLAASLFDIGARENGVNPVNGNVVWFACGTGTLTDADAATINGFGSTIKSIDHFPQAAAATLYWPAVTTVNQDTPSDIIFDPRPVFQFINGNH